MKIVPHGEHDVILVDEVAGVLFGNVDEVGDLVVDGSR